MGLYVITCDNNPQNPGHAYADEYHNVSITDKEAVLALARELKVDAVVNYILEAGIQAAAFVQEQLGKPTSPYRSIHTLSNKILFRQFLKDNGFATPKVYATKEAEGTVVAEHPEEIEYPVVVKPTDLWGSRGFSKVLRQEDLQNAIDYAMDNSLHGEIIIEQFIEPWHSPVEGDGFGVEGKLTAHLWGDCYGDPDAPNFVTPVLYCFPSEKPKQLMDKFDSELQRLMDLLHMKTNAYNVEARFDDKGNVYLMEVAPRNGGNALTDILGHATGRDSMVGTLRAALGEDCSEMTAEPCHGYWCNYVVHSNVDGIFDCVWMDEEFKNNNLVSFTSYIEKGEEVHAYTGTNCSVGMLIAKFPDRESQHAFMSNPSKFFKVLLR